MMTDTFDFYSDDFILSDFLDHPFEDVDEAHSLSDLENFDADETHSLSDLESFHTDKTDPQNVDNEIIDVPLNPNPFGGSEMIPAFYPDSFDAPGNSNESDFLNIDSKEVGKSLLSSSLPCEEEFVLEENEIIDQQEFHSIKPDTQSFISGLEESESLIPFAKGANPTEPKVENETEIFENLQGRFPLTNVWIIDEHLIYRRETGAPILEERETESTQVEEYQHQQREYQHRQEEQFRREHGGNRDANINAQPHRMHNARPNQLQGQEQEQQIAQARGIRNNRWVRGLFLSAVGAFAAIFLVNVAAEE